MSGLLTALSAATTADEVGLPARESLTTLLTTESLIFAAFSVSATLALPSKSGRSLFFAQGRFAYTVVIVLFGIATCAWFALYATLEPALPSGVNAWVRAAGIALGITAQPFFAWAIAHAAVNTRVPYDSNDDEE